MPVFDPFAQPKGGAGIFDPFAQKEAVPEVKQEEPKAKIKTSEEDYGAGAFSHDRKIVKPVSGTITVTGGSGVSIDHATGIVTVASGAPTAWTGEFDTPARFDSDEMRLQVVQTSPRRYVWGDISLTEIRA
jgi:uncharacterized protein (TIGR02217 family)